MCAPLSKPRWHTTWYSVPPPGRTGESPISAQSKKTAPSWRGLWTSSSVKSDGKLTVVDYKTDHVRPEALKTRATFYAPQVAAYERVLRAATDTPISSRLLFLGSTSESPGTSA